MAQSSQATPTMVANLNGTNTKVNLRDWLNTRMAPFLKQAIIDSLDAEAEFPLQWLGEQLILQSITFEGNPDTNNIRDYFLYKHEIKSSSTQSESHESLRQPEEAIGNATSQQTSSPAPIQNAQISSSEAQSQPQTVPAIGQQLDAPMPEPSAAVPALNAPAMAETTIVSAEHPAQPPAMTEPTQNGVSEAEDAEMSNAP